MDGGPKTYLFIGDGQTPKRPNSKEIKMKKEDLTALGLTDEQIGKVFEFNGKDVNSAKESTKAEMQVEIDNLNSQLKTAKEAVSKFDGIDPEQMNAEIQKLNEALATQQNEFQKKLADRDFNDLLSKSISEIGGKNAKAISALLDIEALKTSKNQKEDITNALAQAKAENDYLFTSDEPLKNAVSSTSNGGTSGKAGSAEASAIEKARAVMGLAKKEK